MLLLLSAVAVPAEKNSAGFLSIGLVSNVPGRTPFSDSRLIEPWGMTNTPDGGPWWVVDKGRGRVTMHSGDGAPLPGLSPLAIIIPVNPGGVQDDAAPTAVVVNTGDGFELAPGAPARLLFVTRDGSIAGWNSDVDRLEAVPVVDNSPRAVYTGAAIAEWRGESTLYVANFRQGRVEVYSGDFSTVLLPETAFIDPHIPDGYAPYNIVNIGGELYVTFALAGADGRDASFGEGFGYVDIFDAEGSLVLRLEHGLWMNAPWALALAPTGFGELGNHLLVGNSGSGRVAVFDPATGAYTGYVMDSRGSALAIPGLRGMGFGNNGLAGPETALFFTADDEQKRQYSFGEIVPFPPLQLPAVSTAPAVLP